ncbi:ABC transporter ATP-binding protein [Pseudochelatococcus sp. B33]
MAAVEFSQVTKTYGSQQVLRDVSLSVRNGEFLTLLGPSGCGKSTLLRILAGLTAQDTGTVSLDGMPVDRLRPTQRDVAMVFQNYALYPHMTAGQNIALPLRMRRLNIWQRLPLLGRFLPNTRPIEKSIHAEVAGTAEALDIAHLLHRKPGQLSGGQRQRIAVGRAMVRHPAVFLMDEPLSNLDARLRVQMRLEISELHRRLGATFIYVTHDQTEAMTMSDRVALMMDGTILQLGPPDEIYADPLNIRVATFIGSPQMNLIEGVLRTPCVIDLPGTELALPQPIDGAPGTRVKVGIRAEHLHEATERNAATLNGTIFMSEHLGADILVHMRLAQGNTPIVARLPAEARPRVFIDALFCLTASPHALLVFNEAGQRLRARPVETAAAALEAVL